MQDYAALVGIFAALALSSAASRRTYLRYKVWLDRTAGSVMMALGIKLVASAQKA